MFKEINISELQISHCLLHTKWQIKHSSIKKYHQNVNSQIQKTLSTWPHYIPMLTTHAINFQNHKDVGLYNNQHSPWIF